MILEEVLSASVLCAVSSWIKQDHFNLICFSAAAVIIFRFELAIFLGLIILIEIIRRNISFPSVMKIGIGASLVAFLASFVIDSFFWDRPIWPEGEVFWFNVVLNKSSNWGVSPFFWYWYSALPRALGTSITLVPFGNKNAKLLIVPALIFISVMSFLPHKELRFIIYTFPLFNISSATFCNKVWTNRHKSMSRWVTSIYIIMHLSANIFLTFILLKVASGNYPGGLAITRLHELVPPETEAHIYIDNLSAQTGVTRFTQTNSNWIYNKTENIPNGSEDFNLFSHLLLEAKSKYSPALKPFLKTHEILDVIKGFSHIHFNYNSFPPFKIKSKPMIFILEKKFIPKMSSKESESNEVSLSRDSSLNQTSEEMSGLSSSIKELSSESENNFTEAKKMDILYNLETEQTNPVEEYVEMDNEILIKEREEQKSSKRVSKMNFGKKGSSQVKPERLPLIQNVDLLKESDVPKISSEISSMENEARIHNENNLQQNVEKEPSRPQKTTADILPKGSQHTLLIKESLSISNDIIKEKVENEPSRRLQKAIAEILSKESDPLKSSKLPPKMNVDDFFEESVEINKIISVNEVVKNSVKEKNNKEL